MKKAYMEAGVYAKLLIITITALLVFLGMYLFTLHEEKTLKMEIIAHSPGLELTTHIIDDGYWHMLFNEVTQQGQISRSVIFDKNNLMAFRVSGSGDEDTKMFLFISQGTNTKTIEWQNGFPEIIDMSQFSPGETELGVIFENASRASVTMWW